MEERVQVIHGDSRDVLRGLADCSIDSIVTDPPYALVSIGKRFGADSAAAAKPGKSGAYTRASAGFMGQKWDTGETAFAVEFWAECFRVLKPGGHVVAFGGTRTFHRLVCAVEDAGFEVRDMIAWLYGSGFPKSHDVSKGIDKAAGAERAVLSEGTPVKRMVPGADQAKVGWEKSDGREFTTSITAPATPEAAAWEGWGTALKPALEPVVLARKPLAGTVAANVLAHGTGSLNIDGCRVGEREARELNRAGSIGYGGSEAQGLVIDGGQGRWPANVVHDGSDDVAGAFPSTGAGGGYPAQGAGFGLGGGDRKQRGEALKLETEGGSAARFFYSAKADADDRVARCSACAVRWIRVRPCACPHPDPVEAEKGVLAPTKGHPTVKPVDLMRYMVRLVTPPGGLVLDPFAGSGTTGQACLLEGFRAILIEREEVHIGDISHRLAHMRGEDAPLFSGKPEGW